MNKFRLLFVFLPTFFAGEASFATPLEIIHDGQRYSCTPTEGGGSAGLCAVASLEVKGYVTSDCQNVRNYSQDVCAAASIRKKGYVTSDCFNLTEGGQCAAASLEVKGYVTSDCSSVKNNAQDACAAASIRSKGYVTSDCLNL